MTQNEEYALESLWHEIWRNRQTGMDEVMALGKFHPFRQFAEGLNQLVSRLTYPRFIERLGGQASHSGWVLENGYGYQVTVGRLIAVIRACELTPGDLTDGLTTINRDGNLMLGSTQVAQMLAKRSGRSRAITGEDSSGVRRCLGLG
jgi:hypothetical protein